MKRSISFAALLLFIDQFTKFYFQFTHDGIRWDLVKKWGFTYIINPGITLNQGISDVLMIMLQIYTLLVVGLIIFGIRYYHKNYRKSVYIDLVFGFLATALIGNLLIDRFFYGGIRDFFITPYGVANFADICGIFALGFFITEFVKFPEFRKSFANAS